MSSQPKKYSRRNFLKATAVGAGLAAFGGVISACQPIEAPTTAPAAPSAAPPADEQVTISYWKSAHSLHEEERMGKVIADFEALNPNIKIDHNITAWDTWDETYSAAFAGGSPPDVSYMPDQFYFKYGEASQLADLGPYVDDPSYESERNAWFKGAWDLGNWRGTQVGIPNIATMYFVYANKTAFEEVGLDISQPPTSYDELAEFASAMTKPDGEQWGYVFSLSFVNQGIFANMAYFHDNGADFLNEAYDGPGFNNEGGVRALAFLTSLVCEHQVTPPMGSFDRAGQLDLFRGGKAAMLMEEVSQHGDFKTQDLGFEYDIFLQPPGSGGQSSFGNFGYFMIAEASEHKDQAWEFIKYITSGPVLGDWAEQHGFVMMRGDVELYKDEPIYAKAQKEVAPHIQGFQAHPAIREIQSAMWGEFEGALSCQRSPEESIESAAEAVQRVLA